MRAHAPPRKKATAPKPVWMCCCPEVSRTRSATPWRSQDIAGNPQSVVKELAIFVTYFFNKLRTNPPGVDRVHKTVGNSGVADQPFFRHDAPGPCSLEGPRRRCLTPRLARPRTPRQPGIWWGVPTQPGRDFTADAPVPDTGRDGHLPHAHRWERGRVPGRL